MGSDLISQVRWEPSFSGRVGGASVQSRSFGEKYLIPAMTYCGWTASRYAAVILSKRKGGQGPQGSLGIPVPNRQHREAASGGNRLNGGRHRPADQHHLRNHIVSANIGSGDHRNRRWRSLRRRTAASARKHPGSRLRAERLHPSFPSRASGGWKGISWSAILVPEYADPSRPKSRAFVLRITRVLRKPLESPALKHRQARVFRETRVSQR